MGYQFYKYNKYSAQKAVCLQGHTHDSKAEASRCDELHLLLRAGKIKNLEFQKDYVIIPALYRTVTLKERYKSGSKKGEFKTKRVCEEKRAVYRADFVYFDNTLQKTVIEDTKGLRTKEYILKRKLMKQLYCDDNTVFIES